MNLIKRVADPKPVKRRVRKYQPTYYSPLNDIFNVLGFDYFSPFGLEHRNYYDAPRINMRDSGDTYVVEADVPGYSEEGLSISLDGRQMTLTGEYGEEVKDEGDKYLIQEKKYSKFTRTVSLPEEANLDEAYASLEKGILTITVPKTKGAEGPKTVTINTKG